jgi:hypothetical protein
MKHLQNKKAKQSEKITPIFEPRCQHGRFGFAAGGVMMHRRRNSAIDPVESACRGRLRFGADTRYSQAVAGAASDRRVPLLLSMPR